MGSPRLPAMSRPLLRTPSKRPTVVPAAGRMKSAWRGGGGVAPGTGCCGGVGPGVVQAAMPPATSSVAAVRKTKV
ncbi:hypothetical protein FQZ97_1081510 [compost metagenome]